MRFQVPQFIDVEDKIFGPFTAKQFVYMTGGAGLCYVIYKFLPLFLAIILIAPIAGLAVALAFLKINGKPFAFIMEAGFKYYIGSKLFLWRKETKKPEENRNNAPTILQASDVASPRLSESKLKDISWKLDVKDVRKEF